MSGETNSGGRRVLFAPETINIAEVTRGIEVAKRMPDGTQCIFTGFSPRNRNLIEDAGFEFIDQEPRLSDAEARLALDFDQGRTRRHPFTREMLGGRVVSERTLLQRLRPAAVVIGVTPSQFISARAEGVPLVFVRPYAYSLPHADTAMRAGATGFRARGTTAERLQDRLATLGLWAFRNVISLPGTFYSVAREHGVRLPRGIFRALTADVNLITSAPHLLPPGVQLPPDHEVVGPIFAHLPGEVPQLVSRLASGQRPVVYFALGSSGNRDLALKVLRGLGRAHCEVLAPVRSHLDEADLADLPGNVHVTDWLPAHRLGDAVDLAITHGGEGTVQTSSMQGWPFIGMPLQLEQRFNVMRCVEFGSARLVEQKRAGEVDWAKLVAEALADDQMRERAAVMARLMTPLDGPGEAAKAIMRVVDSQTRL